MFELEMNFGKKKFGGHFDHLLPTPHLRPTSPHLTSPIPKPPHQPSIVLETMKNQKKTWFG